MKLSHFSNAIPKGGIMPVEFAQDLLACLREAGLLEEAHLEELLRQADGTRPAAELARELTERGWLTTYQAELLLRGDGHRLRVGPYCLLEWLGKGGMGEVFKARHRHLGRHAALKLIRREQLGHPDSVLRFRREARAAARLEHPNVVTVYDADRAGDIHFIAMEYVEGTDLGRLLRANGPLPAAEASECIRQAALGLQHAHEQGLVHRDLKPGNLMLTCKGPEQAPTIKILDFGLARFLSELSDDAGLTPTGQWVGTPEFLAPEQARDSKSADIRADIFSLGCTLFRLLTDQPAFEGETSTDKITARLIGEARSLPALLPGAPAGLESVLARMLARAPDARYQMPAEVAAALAPFCKEATELAALAGKVGRTPSAAADPTRSAEGTPRPGPAQEPTPRPGATSAVTETSGASPTSHSTVPLPASGVGWLSSHRRHLTMAAGLLAVSAAAVLAVLLLNQGHDRARPHPGPPGDPAASEKIFINSVGMKLVRIPAGKFFMGAPPGEEGRDDLEGPRHEVQIPQAFYLGAYEVTQGEYEAVMGINPSHFAAAGEGRRQVQGLDTRRYPVENVSWDDAQMFCRALSTRPHEKKAGRIYRLPTEAEWEYACRAGTTTAFAFGDKLSSAEANFDGNRPYGGAPPGVRRQNTVPVGSFAPNAWGLYDMHGNVWEWCQDWQDSYAALVNNDRREHRPADDRIMRGGAWNFGASECRSARRMARAPFLRGPFYGFRVACGPGQMLPGP
jgi:formylglycine-generating enzyme required for sulfatase activity/tRNA A-37 threonylcarbamoyl transferase component Bud32